MICWGHDVMLLSFSSESRGVAILFKSGLDYKIKLLPVMKPEIY